MKITRIAAKVMSFFCILPAFAAAQVVLTGNSFTSSSEPKTNYSSSIALVVGSGASTYLQFSFANLPSGLNGSNVSGANVILYADAVLTSGTMDVYAVNGSWSASKITCNNAPALGSKIRAADLPLRQILHVGSRQRRTTYTFFESQLR